VNGHYKYDMIIFTPERTSRRQNPCFFHILSEIAKQHDLKFLPNVTHPNQDWTQELADQALADPNSVIEFKNWAHIDLFKHSTRKKIILLDQFEPHDFYKYLLNGVIYPLDPDNCYPRPRLHAPVPAIDHYPDCIDYSWADLIIGIQEECLVGPQWIEFFNNPGAYFHTHPDRVITIVSGANSDISYQNVFPPNVLRVPLNMWCSWVTACNTPVEYQADYNRPYKFEALLGGSKENRQFVYRKLKNHGLLEQGLLSISAQTFRAPTDRVYHDDYYRSPALDVYDTETMLALRTTSRKDNWVAHTTGCPDIDEFPLGNGKSTTYVKPFISFFIPHRVYQESWFSIVAESIVRHCDFYTEKTAKALLGRRIFITFGPQYSLKVLRDHGFKTFGNWIDESYDDEPDDEIRWTRAFEQVVRLINHPSLKSLYAEAQAVIEHNYQLVSDQRYLLKPIDDFIQSHLNGAAPSQIGLAPMVQNWTPAQRISSDKNHQPVQVEYTSESAAHAPSFYPPVRFGPNIIAFDSTTVAQPVETTVPRPVATIVPQPTRRFNDPNTLQGLELARAETAKRRHGVGSLQGLELARAETAKRRQQSGR
jgi:hypothetical protein